MKHFSRKISDICLGIACAAPLVGCSTTDTPSKPMTIACYNIRSFRGLDNVKNVDRTLAALKKLNFDLCALQEVRKENIDTVAPIEYCAEKLGMKAFFAQALLEKTFVYGVGTISKYPTTLVDIIKLPVAGNREPRVAQILKVQSPNGELYFVNTHFSYEDGMDQERLDQLKTILNVLDKNQYTPAIIAGDLNAEPNSPAINLLAEHCQIIGDVTPGFPANKPRVKIDYMAFYPKNAFTVSNFRVVEDPASSDHRPIIADLTWK